MMLCMRYFPILLLLAGCITPPVPVPVPPEPTPNPVTPVIPNDGKRHWIITERLPDAGPVNPVTPFPPAPRPTPEPPRPSPGATGIRFRLDRSAVEGMQQTAALWPQQRVTVFVRAGCAPCSGMRTEIKDGDNEMGVDYSSDWPSWASTFAAPMTFDAESRQYVIGRQTLQQLKQRFGRKKQSSTASAYPDHGNRIGHPNSVMAHLQEGVHAGKFTAAQLQAMNVGQLEQLHYDDHNNRVMWQHLNPVVSAGTPMKARGTVSAGTVEGRAEIEAQIALFINAPTGIGDANFKGPRKVVTVGDMTVDFSPTSIAWSLQGVKKILNFGKPYPRIKALSFMDIECTGFDYDGQRLTAKLNRFPDWSFQLID